MISLKNEKKIRIKEISQLFQVPVSTLHYWEKEGLLKVDRSNNKYREYNKKNLFEIWELNLYRKMQIPIEKLKKMNQLNIEQLEEVLDDTAVELEEKVKEQMENLNKLIQYKHNLKEWKRLEHLKDCLEEPDMEVLYKDPFNEESMKKTMVNPMDCCLYICEGNNYQPVMCIPEKEDKAKIVWKKDNHENKKYVVTGIKTEVGNSTNNNIREKINELHRSGYKTGDIVTRFLFSAWENEKYDYHKAWIELK